MLTNLKWYIVGLVIILGPLGWRVWSRATTERPDQNPASIDAGKTLFVRQWQPHDPMSPNGDGLGPVYNARSCVECHAQGGVGGAGGLRHNVTTFMLSVPGRPTRSGIVHAFASAKEYLETLGALNPTLPYASRPSLSLVLQHGLDRIGSGGTMALSQRNTPALFGIGLIDRIPQNTILAEERKQRFRHGLAKAGHPTLPVGRIARLADGRIGKFGWKGQSASISDFVQAACANELGLSNPGQPQPKPFVYPKYQSQGHDLTLQQCDQISAFCASLPNPIVVLPEEPEQQEAAAKGKNLFSQIGCAECHTPNLGSVEGLYSDLLLHKMGTDLQGAGAYYGTPIPVAPDGTSNAPGPDEWRTPPLWGVADSAPYLHDGRAATLKDAIELHKGQAEKAAGAFRQLPKRDQEAVVEFLKTLRAPQPMDLN
ncbi:MAG: di-heme oxidoredictase family protein [Gemmataceae bacterium]